MRKVVDMSNDPNSKHVKKEKVKKSSAPTSALKTISETKFCKDCKEYRFKKCKI